jgi:hypothetical protein
VIQVRAFFGKWVSVDRERAASFARQMMSGFSAIRDVDNKYKRLDNYHLKGIGARELLGA